MKTSRAKRSAAKKQRWKLASADFTFPLLPHDKVLDLIAALEMDGIDIGLRMAQAAEPDGIEVQVTPRDRDAKGFKPVPVR